MYMKLKEFIDKLDENLKLALYMPFSFENVIYEDRFEYCYNLANYLISSQVLTSKQLAKCLKILPSSYAKAILIISEVIKPDCVTKIKEVSKELNTIYVEQFKRVVKKNPKNFISYDNYSIKKYRKLTKRVVDSVEIMAIARMLTIDYKQILGKYVGEDLYAKILSEARHNLNNGLTYEKHRKIIEEIFFDSIQQVYKNIDELKLNIKTN